MTVKTRPILIQICEYNYARFKSLIHWRMTGHQEAELPCPTADELAFANREGFWVWAAEVDGKLVGWISFCLIPKPDRRAGLIFVDELWTAEEYRRRGVAETLMEKAIATARELNLWKVRLYVGEDNPGARAFYKKMGFTEDDAAIFCQRNP